MIRQLRRKMVATAMVSLFVVLTVILCAIHWVNYRAHRHQQRRGVGCTGGQSGDVPPAGAGRVFAGNAL